MGDLEKQRTGGHDPNGIPAETTTPDSEATGQAPEIWIKAGTVQTVTMQMFLDSRTLIRAPHMTTETSEEVVGNALFAIPLLDAESYEADSISREMLRLEDRASGDHLITQRIGDPYQSGGVYKSLRTPRLAEIEAQEAVRWVEEFYKTGRADWHRMDEMELAARRFGLSDNDIPAIVFLATEGEDPVGILRLNSAWYESEKSWRLFSLCFRNWMMRHELVKLAFAQDRDHDHLREELRPLLDLLTMQASRLILGRDDETLVRYTAVVNGVTRELDCVEYDDVTHSRKFDLVVDCPRKTVHWQGEFLGKLTRSEIDMLSDFASADGPLGPRETLTGRGCASEAAAKQVFKTLQKKLRTKVGTAVFRKIRGLGARPTQYHLSTQTGVSNCIVLARAAAADPVSNRSST
ncbi:MAG: hypothetical protein R3E97_24840 [Candidatus Eisenbacteria bacterium]